MEGSTISGICWSVAESLPGLSQSIGRLCPSLARCRKASRRECIEQARLPISKQLRHSPLRSGKQTRTFKALRQLSDSSVVILQWFRSLARSLMLCCAECGDTPVVQSHHK
eukprot:1350368-Amphidinium_carterae.1